MTDDPRDPIVDPLVQLRADIDQHAATAGELARVLVAEWRAAVDAGMPHFAAAVLVGTRWSATSG